MADKDLWKLVAGPIQAINEAEHNNALQFAELLGELAFTSEVDAETQELRSLSFKTTVPDELGSPQEQLVTIPMLQLVPIGGVTVDRAKLTYSLRARTDDSTRDDSSRRTISALPRFIGDLGQKSGNSTDDGNITLEIELKQIDLPSGLLDALNITRARLEPINNEDPDPDPDPDPDEEYRPIISVSSRKLPKLEAKINYSFEFVLNQKEPVKEKLSVEVISQRPHAVQVISPTEPIVMGENARIGVVLLTTGHLNTLNPETQVSLVFVATGVESGLVTRTNYILEREPVRR